MGRECLRLDEDAGRGGPEPGREVPDVSCGGPELGRGGPDTGREGPGGDSIVNKFWNFKKKNYKNIRLTKTEKE